ncbi:hypothetical protein OEZ86_004705 [Tetradesmus obliquus]|uniref:Uncharacterized protein n=2 Tax=Tetradesmus obliquus TaxID=3088 RepID=A0A383WI00_TETOB|nr:hypothetical protein OEZ85_005146 [Tetradesmus obliquus]WIA41071.1 hypothetical protein OEZ86_004705 [Tetradesmus obliquus]|eukprot:jgi/Sobl393_1/19597/SZX77051.1
MALFGKRAGAAVVEKPKTTKQTTTKGKSSSVPKELPKESFMSQTLNAFDFAAVRSKKDAELLYEAKYGERGPDGKMTPEQYQALRRKIGGTARDYWKDWVEEEQVKNIKTYYKPDDKVAAVPYLPFLVGVLVAMLAATAVVVQKTSV